MATVYAWIAYDGMNGNSVRIDRLATREAIERRGGRPLESTGREVDDRLVDLDGLAIVELKGADRDLLVSLHREGGRQLVRLYSLDDDVSSVRLRKVNLVRLSVSEEDSSAYIVELTELGELAMAQL